MKLLRAYFSLCLWFMLAQPALGQAVNESLSADEINAALAKGGPAIHTNFYYFSKATEETGYLWWKVPSHDASQNKAVLKDFERSCLIKQIDAVKGVDWKGAGIDPTKVKIDLISYARAVLSGNLWSAQISVELPDNKSSPLVTVDAYVRQRPDDGSLSSGKVTCNILTTDEIKAKVAQSYEKFRTKGMMSTAEKTKVLDALRGGDQPTGTSSH